VSAIRSFVTDVPAEGAIIFAYMHMKIFALSTTLAGSLRVVSYGCKYTGKLHQSLLSLDLANEDDP
jgi:hypothetical protein